MKRLPRLSKSGVLTPPQWDAVARVIEDNFREATIQPGVGYTVKNSPGGASLEIKTAGSSSSPKASFPFQCTLFPQTNEDGSPAGNKVGVEYNSILFKSLIPLEEFSGITGLNDPEAGFLLDLDGPDDTTDYTSPSGPDDYVFLEIKLNEAGDDIETVSIETNGNGSTIDPTYTAWDNSGDALLAHDENTATPPVDVQTHARVVLAIYQDGQLQQCVRNHLVMRNMCMDGRPAIYPVPF